MTVQFDENLSSSECQLSSIIQGTSGEQKMEEVKPVEVKGVEE